MTVQVPQNIYGDSCWSGWWTVEELQSQIQITLKDFYLKWTVYLNYFSVPSSPTHFHQLPNFTNPPKDLLKLNNHQTDLIKRSHCSISERHGWKNRQHPGVFQPTLELCYRKTQPGGLQHGLPDCPPNSPPACPPHNPSGVLSLLLLSPCQQLLLLLL